jgi:hypothetical protein
LIEANKLEELTFSLEGAWIDCKVFTDGDNYLRFKRNRHLLRQNTTKKATKINPKKIREIITTSGPKRRKKMNFLRTMARPLITRKTMKKIPDRILLLFVYIIYLRT